MTSSAASAREARQPTLPKRRKPKPIRRRPSRERRTRLQPRTHRQTYAGFAPMEALNPTLAELGWKPFFSAQLSAAEDFQPVRVMSVHRGMVTILGEGIDEMISSTLATPKGPEDRPTVGDWLLIDRQSHGLVRILDRKSLFKRPAPGDDRRVQLIAANVDTLFIVTSCDQDFNVARIERYLVLAREVSVRPVVILTKADLSPTPD